MLHVLKATGRNNEKYLPICLTSHELTKRQSQSQSYIQFQSKRNDFTNKTQALWSISGKNIYTHILCTCTYVNPHIKQPK